MEGIEHLSLTEDTHKVNSVLSYTATQLCHHEAVQVFLANLPLEGAQR
jgi:hypothetical protein